MLSVCNHLSHNEKLVRANCEVCGGARLKIFTRKRYLITAGVYMALSGLFLYIYLAGHHLNLYVGLLSGALLIASVIACVWFVLLACTRSEATYKCRSCGYYDWLDS